MRSPVPASMANVLNDSAVEALQASESRYRRLFETAQDGILLLNADTAQIEDVNPYLINLLGYSHAEFLGRKLWEVGGFADMAQSKMLFKKLQKKSYVRYDDFPLKTKTGIQIAVEFVSKSYDCEGVKFIQCRIRDITEHKEIQQKAGALVLRHQLQMQISFDGICVMDMKGDVLEVNDAFCHMLGYTQEEMACLNVADWNAQWSPEELRQIFRKLIGKSELFETIHRRKDGTLIEVEISTTGLEADGRSCIYACSRKITERKLAQRELIFKNLMLQTLQETSLDAILLVDENERIVSYNQQFTDLWQVPREVVNLGHDAPVLKLVVDQVEHAEAFIARIQYLYKRREEKSRENIQLKDGRIIDRYSAPVTGADGKYYGRVWYFRDITERKKSENALRKSKDLLQTVVENVPVRVFWKDIDSRYLGCNSQFARDTAHARPEMLTGKTDFEMRWKDQAEAYIADDKAVMESGVSKLNYVEPQTAQDGSFIWLRTSKVPLRVVCKLVVGILGIYEDITKQKQAELELRIAATAIEAQEGIMITDANKVILRVNQSFTRLTGYSAEEAIGQTPALLQSGRQDAEFYREMWETLKRDHYWQGEIWNRRKNGEAYPEWLSITAVINEERQVTNYIGSFSDITRRKAADAKIEHLAFYDPLTDLPNRRLLHDRLQHNFAVSARHHNHGAVLFIDLDNFKTLNDTRGHNIGDLLLIEVSKRLKDCTRSEDTVARLGGDEFVVTLAELGKEEALAAAQAEAVSGKILAAISQPYSLSGHEYHCTASIGVCLFCQNDNFSVEDALKHADVAMYQAKNAGRNVSCFFDPVMQKILEARAALESDLRVALVKNQFKLYYQMQVECDDHIVGAEVLIRWLHPQRGLVSPMEFIPLAEETGLILPIGQWVLETACAQLKVWETSPLACDLQLAVNVSASQFRQPDFVRQVRQTLRRYAVKASRLKLELTEGMVLDNVDDTVAKMTALRKIGVRFSMDDFGTGYSSLAYLTQLPLDQLKIDQSFVRNIGVKSTDAVIVQTIIVMANSLGMQVIAEGVETEEQRAFLEQNECTLYQGYLFGKPVPVEEFEAKLKSS